MRKRVKAAREAWSALGSSHGTRRISLFLIGRIAESPLRRPRAKLPLSRY